ncbi:hypothetical protein B0H14DRAFT_2569746 [Mycena olivaceomarginata]|nr:hypothetical protein B0H14DRAFT_2569746 [Mycena olivaceomarginata]
MSESSGNAGSISSSKNFGISSSSGGDSLTSEHPSGIISSRGSSHSITSFGNGRGKATMIPSSNLFSGRNEGIIYGTQAYGSGYPGMFGHTGVGGRGFPYFFWLIAWGTHQGYRSDAGGKENS